MIPRVLIKMDAEALPRQMGDNGVGLVRHPPLPMREEIDAERGEIAIGAMTFDDQEPIEWHIGPFGFDAAGKPDPGEREVLMAPIFTMHDGIAGENRSYHFSGGR